MANEQTVTVDAYLAALESKLAAKFPLFKTVVAHPDDHTKLPAYPALTIEIPEFQQASTHDGGAGQLSMDFRVECHLIFPFKLANIKRKAPGIAAQVAEFAHLNRWGVYAEPADVIGCYDDAFDPGLDQFVVWRVDWHQVLDLGANVWADDPNYVTPTTVQVEGDVRPTVNLDALFEFPPRQ